MNERHQGIGMTSQRTRDRLIDRLREQGIRNTSVLEVMRSTPRHIVIEEALASRAVRVFWLARSRSPIVSPYASCSCRSSAPRLSSDK